MAKKHSFKSAAGFTLIELLVVISILALLMSIMMPSLQRAREIAKKVICGNNLRQIGVAMSMYQNSNDGYFTRCYISTGPSHLGYESSLDNIMWQQLLLPYASNDGTAFVCPNFVKRHGKDDVVSNQQNNWLHWYSRGDDANFGFNHKVLGCGGDPDTVSAWGCVGGSGNRPANIVRPKVSQVSRASELIMVVGNRCAFGRSPDDYGVNSDASALEYQETYYRKYNRHLDGLNMIFVDNHIDWAKMDSEYFSYTEGRNGSKGWYGKGGYSAWKAKYLR